MLYGINKFLVPLLFIHSITIGCGGISSPETDEDEDEEQSCSPGQIKGCRCSGGEKGKKVCLDSQRYSSCQCEVSEDEDSIERSGNGSSDNTRPNSSDSVIDDEERADASRLDDSEDDADENDDVVDGGADMDADSEETQDSGESDDDEADADSQDTSTTSDDANTEGHEGNDASAGNGGSGGESGTGGTGGSGGDAGSGGEVVTGGTGGEGGSGGGGGTGGYEDYEFFCDDEPTTLPTPTEPCPTIVTTYIDEETSNPLTFRGKQTEIFVEEDPDPKKKGPVVFYWHGLGGHPYEVFWGLGIEAGLEIVARGGMVVAMYADQTGSGGSVAPDWDNGHLNAADEILACAIEQIGIDTCRIHAMGFSAGGLMTTQMSYRRSNYIASVVPYSGGIIYRAPAHQDPSNKFAAMIVHGGASDEVGINFEDASTAYLNDLIGNGHFAFICNHGGSHTIADDIIAPAWKFLKDHPYGVTPEPYQDDLPSGFPGYCSL